MFKPPLSYFPFPALPTFPSFTPLPWPSSFPFSNFFLLYIPLSSLPQLSLPFLHSTSFLIITPTSLHILYPFISTTFPTHNSSTSPNSPPCISHHFTYFPSPYCSPLRFPAFPSLHLLSRPSISLLTYPSFPLTSPIPATTPLTSLIQIPHYTSPDFPTLPRLGKKYDWKMEGRTSDQNYKGFYPELRNPRK